MNALARLGAKDAIGLFGQEMQSPQHIDLAARRYAGAIRLLLSRYRRLKKRPDILAGILSRGTRTQCSTLVAILSRISFAANEAYSHGGGDGEADEHWLQEIDALCSSGADDDLFAEIDAVCGHERQLRLSVYIRV